MNPGIRCLVRSGEEPALLADDVVNELRSRERGGFITLPPPLPPGSPFRPGDRVRVKTGPMSGLSGLVSTMKAHERVSILLEMLGSMRPIEMAAVDVALI